jgi:hypothetical protein
LIVTDDDQHHTVSPSPGAMTTLLALTLIAANIVGTWLATTGLTRATVTTQDQ